MPPRHCQVSILFFSFKPGVLTTGSNAEAPRDSHSEVCVRGNVECCMDSAHASEFQGTLVLGQDSHAQHFRRGRWAFTPTPVRAGLDGGRNPGWFQFYGEGDGCRG